MTSDDARVFIDTNILVYCWDSANRTKQQTAIEVVERLRESERGLISVQVLGEFFTTTTRRLNPALPLPEAARRTREYATVFPVIPSSVSLVLAAIDATISHQIGYWDALIWATAREGASSIVVSEDVQSSGVLDGVRYVNPFARGFEMAALG